MEVRSPPPELEKMILEYVIAVLKDKPSDLVSHAADYFTQLDEASNKKMEFMDDGSKENIDKVLGPRFSRRGTIFGEQYNPEEDDEVEEEEEIIPKTDDERERIREKCSEIFLFRVLDESDLNAIIDAMTPKHVEKGQIIIQQGDDGDFFYLIDKGQFTAEIKDKEGNENVVANYEDEGYFGELALLHNQPRAATVKAASDGSLWAISRKTFNRLVVKRAFEKRQLYMNLLDGVPELKPLTEYEKMQVADALKGKEFLLGEVIVEEGAEGDGMYFIVEGKVSVKQKVSLDDGMRDVEINQLGKGEYFGELALIEYQPRAATVVAIEDTKVAFLDVKAFERLLGPCIQIFKRHTETYARKK